MGTATILCPAAPDDDVILGAALLSRPSDCLRVLSTGDKELVFGQQKYELTSRGGKGIRTIQRAGFAQIVRNPIELVDWSTLEGKGTSPVPTPKRAVSALPVGR